MRKNRPANTCHFAEGANFNFKCIYEYQKVAPYLIRRLQPAWLLPGGTHFNQDI